jgi:DNA-directed RNA polymerase subunit RPC12/RpoP
MANDPGDEEVEVEVICPRCGHRFVRTVGRLRRETPVVCPNCGCRTTEDGGRTTET